jgi:hypothetical protein
MNASHLSHPPAGVALPWWMRLTRSIQCHWVNSYGRFQCSALDTVFDVMNRYLEQWLRRKYKRRKYQVSRAREMLRQKRRRQPALFARFGCTGLAIGAG